jgi:hypothetical protein
MQKLQQQAKSQIKIEITPHDQQIAALETAIKSIRKTLLLWSQQCH